MNDARAGTVIEGVKTAWSGSAPMSREYRVYSEALGRLDRAPSIRALEDRIAELEDALEGLHLADIDHAGARTVGEPSHGDARARPWLHAIEIHEGARRGGR